MLIPCPFMGCPFEGSTDQEVDDHVTYMVSVDDPEHREGNRRF